MGYLVIETKPFHTMRDGVDGTVFYLSDTPFDSKRELYRIFKDFELDKDGCASEIFRYGWNTCLAEMCEELGIGTEWQIKEGLTKITKT